jgi:hypothetical protein
MFRFILGRFYTRRRIISNKNIISNKTHRFKNLQFESLESRELLSGTLSWTGGGDHQNWSDIYNWSPARIPTDGDDLQLYNQTYPSTYNNLTSNPLLHSISFADGVSISGNKTIYMDGSGCYINAICANASISSNVHIGSNLSVSG